ncbi:MAG: response regulator [Bdellovibrionota bacterium]
MKPLIFYVDDEPHNLTVFEAALGDEWEVLTFDNPMQALKEMDKKTPWIIVSDQRMPNISGVEFLELSMKLHPNAVRMIVTGYSDENLVVESVRRAKVFDYIRKPWDYDDLEKSLARGIEFYKTDTERIRLQEEVKKREEELKTRNNELLQMTVDLEKANKNEIKMRQELECWVPPFVLWAINDNKIKFPMKKDIVGITFDIINSSAIHEIKVKEKSLRGEIIRLFSELIIKHGGWRESHTGDSAYGHFGLFEDSQNPREAALAVAREFRVALRSLCSVNNISVECGIALHTAKDSVVDIHTVQLNTPKGNIIQKSFDTTSSDIDLLHRIEKFVHTLPGTNIIMTKDFLHGLNQKPENIIALGSHKFLGQSNMAELYLIPSDRVKPEDIDSLKQVSKAA